MALAWGFYYLKSEIILCIVKYIFKAETTPDQVLPVLEKALKGE